MPRTLKSLKSIVVLFSTVAFLIGGLIVTPSYGQANTETSINRNSFESSGIPLCGGEEVAFSGTIFTVTHVTEGPDGKFQLRVDHFGLQHTTAVGLVTGTKYIIKESDQTVSSVSEISDNEFQVHATVNGQLIGQGKAPNTGFSLTFQLVVGADGEVKVESVHENTRC